MTAEFMSTKEAARRSATLMRDANNLIQDASYGMPEADQEQRFRAAHYMVEAAHSYAVLALALAETGPVDLNG
jgi:hypothetical protein